VDVPCDGAAAEAEPGGRRVVVDAAGGVGREVPRRPPRPAIRPLTAHLPEGDVPVDGDVLRQAEDPSPMMLRWISSEPPAIDAEGIERARR
jgi:hypothetical protein